MNESITSLADIIEPATPVITESSPSLWITGVALAMVMIAAVYVWFHSRAHRRTRAHLRDLQKQYVAGDLTQRELAYRLAAHLRDIYGKHRLAVDSAPATATPEQRAAWQSVLNQLDALRYQAHHELDVTRLLAETRRCLR